MTNVAFEEEQGLPIPAPTRPRGLAAVLIKWGLVRTETQANILLILVALIIGAAAAYVFMAGQPEPSVMTPQELLELERMQAAGSR